MVVGLSAVRLNRAVPTRFSQIVHYMIFCMTADSAGIDSDNEQQTAWEHQQEEEVVWVGGHTESRVEL